MNPAAVCVLFFQKRHFLGAETLWICVVFLVLSSASARKTADQYQNNEKFCMFSLLMGGPLHKRLSVEIFGCVGVWAGPQSRRSWVICARTFQRKAGDASVQNFRRVTQIRHAPPSPLAHRRRLDVPGEAERALGPSPSGPH